MHNPESEKNNTSNNDGLVWFDAVRNRSLLVIKLLLDIGADVELFDESNMTALMVAAEKGHTCVAQLLLDGGAVLMSMRLIMVVRQH